MITTRNCSSFVHSIVAIVFLSMFVAALISAQTNWSDDLTEKIKQHATWDPAQFILDKLCTNRIVMLADAGHGDPLYYRVVVNSLNRWVSAWEHEKQKENLTGLPSKVFLVLEMDSLRVTSLKHYFQTGNLVETIEPVSFWGFQFTTGTFEFYDNLRTFRHRVDAFNRNNAKDKQLSFDIVGPEKIIDLNNWTTVKKDSFFVYERDEYSSSKIKDLLERDPDAKALIYYGNAHLWTEKVQKLANNKQSMGYFLGHYLTDSFAAKGGAYECDQREVSQNPYLDHAVSKIGKTFAIDISNFNGVAIEPNAWFQSYDGTIFHVASPRHATHLSLVFSENMVDYILDSIDTYRDSTKEFYRGNIDTWLFYLANLTVTEFHPLDHTNAFAVDSTIKAWKNWRKSSKLDIVEDLSSLRYFRRYVDLIRTSNERQSTWYQMQLAKLAGFKVWFPNNAPQQVRADSIWMYVNKYHKPIVIQNLINLLWVGSKIENEKALVILKKETGQNYHTAKQWMAWWESQQSN